MFADVTFSTESLAVVTVLVVALTGAVGMLFKLLISTKDQQRADAIAMKDKEAARELADKEKALKELDSVKRSYQEIAAEALKSATETANFYRNKEGKPPIIPVAPVISESHSPSTAEQRETAAIATMRASLAHVKLLSGQEPRVEPEHALEGGKSAVAAADATVAVAKDAAKIVREQVGE